LDGCKVWPLFYDFTPGSIECADALLWGLSLSLSLNHRFAGLSILSALLWGACAMSIANANDDYAS
jgi:hypothetical protein